MARILYCRKSLVKSVNGRRVSVKAGDLVYSDDPVVEGSEYLFAPVEDRVRRFGNSPEKPVVEQATAEPGEVRTTRRGRPKKEKVEDVEGVTDAQE